MAQRDKVKELVGRGLNSYHTKALQQIDRIEKKNKEQNHKISILSNELDNDYLTKTEEGSVVSLEHSKEGMVYLDGLQGNTMVNYCTDGSKELTLNGDIDVEGVSVTTTEGVDNGKVDIMCEGNTLVNLSDYKSLSFTKTGEESGYKFKEVACPLVKTNTTYTVFVNITKNQNTVDRKVGFTFIHNGGLASNEQFFSSDTGFKCFTLTTRNMDAPKGINFRFFCGHGGSLGEFACDDLVILEGDWTNREIPPYFEGMKSVGQDDTNGHKIEILSRNKNLYKDEYLFNCSIGSTSGTLWGTGRGGNRRSIKMPCKPNTTYTLQKNGGDRIAMFAHHEDFDANTNTELSYKGVYGDTNTTTLTFTTPSNAKVMCLYVSLDVLPTDIIIVEGSIVGNYIEPKFNKKEISLNEPLRGLPNGVKDRFVKKDGKWYVERNCGEVVLNGSEDWGVSGSLSNNTTLLTYIDIVNAKDSQLTIICDKYNSLNIYTVDNMIEGMYIGANKRLFVRSFKSKLPTQDVPGFKTWLQQNPTTVVYQLATPTYEPLDIEPTLSCYNDTNHISNNSIIPCNMKIKNSGYNAIIKPSTLYTVALDTNKSGTIGMNLGGVKGTTTNNVLTLTTPATLTDDSLRLYGKGIKGSKVRLLEGDKTNWIPSHFEGMKSSFEDKVQEDGSYSVEILSNNKNWLEIDSEIRTVENMTFYSKELTKPIPIRGKRFSYRYDYEIISISKEQSKFVSNLAGSSIHNKTQTIMDYDTTIINSRLYNGAKGTVVINNKISSSTWDLRNIRCIRTLENVDMVYKITNFGIYIEDIADKYIPQKSNKIQFSSIEPLRSVSNTIADKIIFKNGKLMIERNCDKILGKDIPKVTLWSNYDKINSLDGFFLDNVQYDNTTSANSGDIKCDKLVANRSTSIEGVYIRRMSDNIFRWYLSIEKRKGIDTVEKCKEYIKDFEFIYKKLEPTYEEIPFELQKLILEGYENGTLFIDTNIPPTITTTYAGETPIVKATRLNKTEVLNNTNDINDNITPYLMDMDYRVVCLQLQTECEGVSMARLFGGTYEMLKRDILSKRLSRQEYGYRIEDYYNAGKLTEEQVRELEDLR